MDALSGAARARFATSAAKIPVLAASLAWALAGCMTFEHRSVYPGLDPEQTYQRLVSSSPHGKVPDADVLALSAELHDRLGEIARTHRLHRQRLSALADLFTLDGDGGEGLGLEYDARATHSAAQTFEEGAGNCLAFTHLFIAMARELGLDARYQEVFGVQRWEEVGDYVLLNRHVGATGDLSGRGSYMVDFGLLEWSDERFGRVISDDRARAQHFNNLGARRLTEGDAEGAVPYFNRALSIDRALSYVWGNLGTAYRRLDDPESAELAYRQALRVDRYDATAATQLSGLYESLGEEELAQAYRDHARRVARENPYRQFHDGVTAMAEGDLDEAVRLLRSAARIQPDELHFQLELGKALALRGDARRARSRLLRAAELAHHLEEKQAVLAALDELEQSAARARRERAREAPGVTEPPPGMVNPRGGRSFFGR